MTGKLKSTAHQVSYRCTVYGFQRHGMQAWHMQHWNDKHSNNVSATVCTALPSTINYIKFYYSVMLSLVLCFICIIKYVFLKPWTSFLDTILGKWQKEAVSLCLSRNSCPYIESGGSLWCAYQLKECQVGEACNKIEMRNLKQNSCQIRRVETICKTMTWLEK